jgi:pimeloyl-ACP methyl ester carboxylesterase
MHKVIIIPGLSDNVFTLKLYTWFWKYYGIDTYYYKVNWRSEELDIDRVIREVVAFSKSIAQNDKISIIGISAGASLAFNSYLVYPKLFSSAIAVCGRLRSGKHKIRSLSRMSRSSKLFENSVLNFERQIFKISSDISEKMLTIVPIYGDQLVPKDTSTLAGVKMYNILSLEHNISIFFALTLYFPLIKRFIYRRK